MLQLVQLQYSKLMQNINKLWKSHRSFMDTLYICHMLCVQAQSVATTVFAAQYVEITNYAHEKQFKKKTQEKED